MAVTQNSYTGNGSTTNYSFTFPYLKSSEVKAQIDATVTTAFTLANATTVQFNTAPANGAKIKIFRETDDSALAATFYAGSAIKSEDLNDNFTQNLYTTQEVNARYLSNLGGTMVGDLTMGEDADIVFEGATDNTHETTLTVIDPTADRVISLPNETGTVITTNSLNVVGHDMIVDGTIQNADISNAAEIQVSKLKDGTARQLLQTDAAGNTTEWTSNIDIPGTLDVTGAATLDSTLNVNNGLSTLASVNIDGGTIDGTHLGTHAPASGNFTTGTIATADINGGAIDGTTIGASSASTGAFTTLTTSSNATVTGVLTAGDFQLSGSGKVASDLIPNVHHNYNLGATNIRWGYAYVNNLNSNGSTLNNSTTIGQNNTTTLTLNSKVGSDIVPTGTRDIGASDAKWNKVWTTDLDVTNGQLNTLGGMQSGTASVLADSTALAATTTEINAICDGKTVQTTISDTDASYPTSGAVVDYVAAQLAPVGGLEVIANEDSFPATQPSSGVVISIADAGGIVVNGSGVSTTARTAGNGSDNVTINGFPSSLYSETLVDNMGLLVSSTGSNNTYTYHKLLGKEDDIKQLSSDINDFKARYRIASSAPSSNNDDGDLYFDTSTKKMKVYNAGTSQWDDVASSSSSYIVTLSESFNGSLTDFTMSTAATDAQSTIVSINGVIQKPNAGTSTPSEGFAISGNTLKLSNAPATGSTYFVVVLGDTVSIGTPSDNTVSTAKIQNLAVTGDKIATNLDLADNKKIRFGTGNDLELHHDGSNSVIANSTGRLIVHVNGNESAIDMHPNGAVELYYDNSKKFQTASHGIDILDDLVFDNGTNVGKDINWNESSNTMRWQDNVFAAFGAGDDLTIYHNTVNYIDSGATQLRIDSDVLRLRTDAEEHYLEADANAAVKLYYDNVKKLETASTGVYVRASGGSGLWIDNQDNAGKDIEFVANQDRLRFNDAVYMTLGSDNDLSMFHSGGTNYCDIAASQQLYFRVDGANKFYVQSGGAQFVGSLYGDDDNKIELGSGQDLKIYHDSSNGQSIIEESGPGVLKIKASDFRLSNAANSADYIQANDGGAVKLFYDGGNKLETKSDGVEIHGQCKAYGNIPSNYILELKNDGDHYNRYGVLIYAGEDNPTNTNYAITIADGNATVQAYVTFTGGTVTWGNFTAHHPCIIPDTDNPSDASMAYPYGTLLETISIEYTQKDGANTERGIRYKVQKTQSANSRKVLGAYGSSMNGGPASQTNEHQALVLGDGHILVNNAGGNIEVGDGICSSATAGIGQKATANPSMIIGIAQEAITFTGSETKLVAVQYGLQQFIPWT